MGRVRFFVGLALLALVAATVACRPAPRTPLLHVVLSGGFCHPLAPCDVDLVVQRDGGWTARTGQFAGEGQLPAEELDALVRHIEAGLPTLDDLPPRRQMYCPSEYDGIDVTVSVSLGGSTVSVTNCDPRDPAASLEVPGDNALLGEVVDLAVRIRNTVIPPRPPSTTVPAGLGAPA
jgi:hypothetical protein